MSTMIQTHGDEARLREQIVEFGRSIFDRGLTAGSSPGTSEANSRPGNPACLSRRLSVSADERLTLIAQLWEPGRRSSAADSRAFEG
jgi:hypothetical protein